MVAAYHTVPTPPILRSLTTGESDADSQFGSILIVQGASHHQHKCMCLLRGSNLHLSDWQVDTVLLDHATSLQCACQ